MSNMRETVISALRNVIVPGRGENLIEADMVRALSIEDRTVRFVIEVDPADGERLEPMRAEAETRVASLEGVEKAVVILTAHGPKPQPKEPPSLKVGRHPTPQAGPATVPGIRNIILVGSGKGVSESRPSPQISPSRSPARARRWAFWMRISTGPASRG